MAQGNCEFLAPSYSGTHSGEIEGGGDGGEGAGVEGSTRALVADPNPPGLTICGFLAAQHLFPLLSVTGYQNHCLTSSLLPVLRLSMELTLNSKGGSSLASHSIPLGTTWVPGGTQDPMRG